MATTTGSGKRAYASRMAPEERREQLLDAALRVIVDQGIHKVSMESVAKAAGVTRPVVYGHFADTDALQRASLEREEQRAVEQWGAIRPVIGEGTPAASAVASFSRFLDAVVASPDLWRAVFVLVESSTPAFRERLERGRDLAVLGLEDLVRWAVDEGLDPDTDVTLLARMLLAMMWDCGRQLLADPVSYPQERLVAFAERAMPRHLGA